MNQNLILRIVSALVLLPLVVYVVAAGGWIMFGVLLFAALVCFWEYGGIIGGTTDKMARPLLVVIGLITVAAGMKLESTSAAFAITQLAAIAIAISYTLNTGDMKTVWARMGAAAFGIPYIALSFIAVFRLRELGDVLPERTSPLVWAWLPLIVSWSNDTCAYFAGRAFGKTKLYEKVSPKKTWEGFLGGAVGSLAIPVAMRFGLIDYVVDVSVVDIVAIALPAAFLAPLGDLCESLLKRSFDTKDSGNLIPGHGGLLDRVDAVFFVAPWALFYVEILRPVLGGM